MVWAVGALASITGLLFWFLLRAERAGAAAAAEAKKERAEDELKTERVEHQTVLEGVKAAQAARDKAVADTRAGTLPDKLQDHYID